MRYQNIIEGRRWLTTRCKPAVPLYYNLPINYNLRMN